MNYTYIVQCSDGTLYTGWTNDLNKRIKAHNNGKGAKYTKPRLPVELVYAKEHATKEEAMKDEYRISSFHASVNRSCVRSMRKSRGNCRRSIRSRLFRLRKKAPGS